MVVLTAKPLPTYGSPLNLFWSSDMIGRVWIAGLKNHGGKVLTAIAVLALLGGEYTGMHGKPGKALAVWNNIGGCGSGGGGAAAGAGKWIGRGVSGGLIDLELLANTTRGGDYQYSALNIAATFHYPAIPNYTAGLSLSSKSNTFEYEGFKVAEDLTSRQTRITGGMGDLGLQINRLFGNENEHSAGISLSLPTGQHNIKRLHFKGQNIEPDDVRWMNPFVQPGSGLYSLGASYEYTRTRDWGLIIFGASYTSAWAWDNQACRDGRGGSINDKVLSCQAADPSPLTWKVWELVHQPFDGNPKEWTDSYGAPGTGATGADGYSVYGYVGHKEESSTQSIGLTFSAPLSPTYYWEYGSDESNNWRASTRIRTNDYTLKISGGIEITNPDFPIFLGFGIPYKLNDIMSRGRLVDPQNYIGTLGIKGTFL
jgi:hypothetical protein